MTFLVLYVDAILFMGNYIPTLQDVKSWLGKCFIMKDLGKVTYILGIRIYKYKTKYLTRLEYIIGEFQENGFSHTSYC